MEVFLRHLIFLLVILLAGCNTDKLALNNGESHVPEEMDEVISSFIVEKYQDMSTSTDKQFEVHKVYGMSEENDLTHLYIWSYYAGFNISTASEVQSGHSLPALIVLKKKEFSYEVINYKEPEDGSDWIVSLEKMFPKKYVKKAQQDAGNLGALEREMDEKVEQWLGEQ